VTTSAAIQRPHSTPALDGRVVDVLLALFVGGSAFLAIVGPQVLDVTNMLWLTHTGDGFQHYIGWEFFRRSPWTWPPGLNPAYGMEFSSSIVFSDSVPLIPLVLKLFSPLMPAVFQYTGWWLLACFILQAYFATLLAGLITRDALVKLAAAIILVFAPPMLWRLSVHFSLVAHWIILASLYLTLAPSHRWRWLHWVLLLGAASLIHTYLFAMCVPIWLTSILRRRLAGASDQLPWYAEIGAVLGTAAMLLALAGFFPLRQDMLGGGYGYFRLNVLSLVNPQGAMAEQDMWRWSSLLPTLPHVQGDYEGFAYGGLGLLAALVLALPLAITERRAYTGSYVWPLVILALVLTLFAISPNVAVGEFGAELPVPAALMDLAGAVRSSGRFFWPVYYMLALGAVWLLHRSFGTRITGPLLLLLAALQVYDTYPGWSSLRTNFAATGDALPTPLDNPELDAVAAQYNAVRMLPAENYTEGWEQVTWFALRNNKPTDAAYLARPDVDGQAAHMAGIDDAIAAHALEPDTLYVVTPDYGAKIAQHMTTGDALFKVGDFNVFAPGWANFGVPVDLETVAP
jgi:hypothetical protein